MKSSTRYFEPGVYRALFWWNVDSVILEVGIDTGTSEVNLLPNTVILTQ